jgi:hypothetical protein
MPRYPRPCSCGSGKFDEAHYDARGIYLCAACEDCEHDKLKRFRPEVLRDPMYEHCEAIDPE